MPSDAAEGGGVHGRYPGVDVGLGVIQTHQPQRAVGMGHRMIADGVAFLDLALHEMRHLLGVACR